MFRMLWDDWVHDAPESWKSDGFLENNVPVACTIRYGQNQPICISEDNAPQERETWRTDRRLSDLRLVVFSIAHHIQ